MATNTSTQSENQTTNVCGKYLTFALAQERYGIEILKVQEIIGVSKITKVPKSPNYLKGVINLRGKIIPIADLRLKMGLHEKEYDDTTCFIVVNTSIDGSDISVGVVVDTVLEVINFEDTDIQPVPDYGSNIDTSFILGMGKVQEHVVILIDINKTLNDSEAILTASQQDVTEQETPIQDSQ